jgi:hypothetical protein
VEQLAVLAAQLAFRRASRRAQGKDSFRWTRSQILQFSFHISFFFVLRHFRQFLGITHLHSFPRQGPLMLAKKGCFFSCGQGAIEVGELVVAFFSLIVSLAAMR